MGDQQTYVCVHYYNKQPIHESGTELDPPIIIYMHRINTYEKLLLLATTKCSYELRSYLHIHI